MIEDMELGHMESDRPAPITSATLKDKKKIVLKQKGNVGSMYDIIIGLFT